VQNTIRLIGWRGNVNKQKSDRQNICYKEGEAHISSLVGAGEIIYGDRLENPKDSYQNGQENKSSQRQNPQGALSAPPHFESP